MVDAIPDFTKAQPPAPPAGGDDGSDLSREELAESVTGDHARGNVSDLSGVE